MHPVMLWLLLLLPISRACIDVLFTIDPSEEHSLARAVKVASDLQFSTARATVAINRNGRYLAKRCKNTEELISTLYSVKGDYQRFLNVVTVEISRRKEVTPPLVVLLFSEVEINKTQMDTWKAVQKAPLHVFRVGTARKTSDLFANEGRSFEELLRCDREKLEVAEKEIRRRPQNGVNDDVIPTTTVRTKAFSRTTRPPTTRRPTTLPGTKARPVFRGRATSATESPPRREQNRITPRPSTTVQTTKAFHAHQQARATSHQPPTTIRPASRLFRENQPTRIIQLTKGVAQKPSLDNPTTTTPKTTTTRRATTTTTTVATTTKTKAAPAGCVADIIFLMDFSRGTGDRTRSYFDIAATAVGTLPIAANAVRIGMIGYSGPGRAEVLFHLDKHDSKDDVIEEMFRMESSGGTTRTGEAIRFAQKVFEDRKHGARKTAKKVIVVFTDGFSQDDPSDAASEARGSGINVISVATDGNPAPNIEELVLISGNKQSVLLSPKGRTMREKILGNRCPL